MTDSGGTGGGLWQASGGEFWRDLIPDIEERSVRKRVDCSAVDEEVQALFMGQVGESLVVLRTAIAATDAMAIRRVAHSLQGKIGRASCRERV